MAASSVVIGSDYVNDDELGALYQWIDSVPKLSRPRRNITRDFADGVMTAEVVHHHLPSWVEMHNYQSGSSRKQKKSNWDTLNKKVFKKFNKKMQVPGNVIDAIISCRPGVVEVVLVHVRRAILRIKSPAMYYEEEQMRNLMLGIGDAVEDAVGEQPQSLPVIEASTKLKGRRSVRPSSPGSSSKDRINKAKESMGVSARSDSKMDTSPLHAQQSSKKSISPSKSNIQGKKGKW